ncbi:methyltransferase domain-containing protein [Metabacillus arenae]|uniref:Class I SAM-dependent methyltransferase n=1 Tax=Metabacillus arenae TaxID=2771434 RepID=A0A926S2A0_9BACI|nr:methyltransferase domain-containing protein [Metabacillus arenae]MBD1381799.1 class I SAM-dependent methyltransferase [Metabacillus arenae]
MNAAEQFKVSLKEFSQKFHNLAVSYDHTVNNCSKLESLIDAYSNFITNKENKETWERLEQQKSSDLKQLVVDLRKKSALCVAIMEKYRALKLQNGEAEITDYFKNIESCIEEEFGSFQVTSDSKVLLVGSGAFPMTPILIAKCTGAEVVGIDIDAEAIELGQNVVEKLGRGLNIRLEKVLVEKLDFTKDATHIIFSSTVESKYDILDQLHTLTNKRVEVAMRYGNQLKSLFNYPLRKVNEQKWEVVEHILRPDNVFDIALYKKA